MNLILPTFLLAFNLSLSSSAVSNEHHVIIQRSEFSLLPFYDPFIDQYKLQEYMKKVEKQVYKRPVNAKIAKNGSLISEKNGYKLNSSKFLDTFYSNYFKQDSFGLELPLQPIYPKVDSELLESIRTKRIGQYVTYFNSQNRERTHNIRLAAEAINNYVVFPNESFSFNKVVGKRTKEKGYLKAPVIVKGELSEDIGGGICQVSSTLFNAVDRSNVKIIERYSHSRKVPYVPPNRDATVSWYGPDFKFMNPYTQPLLIQANVVGGQLYVSILSSDSIIFKQKEVPSAPRKLPVEVNTKEKNLQHKPTNGSE